MGAPFVADLGEALGLDGQTKNLGLVGHQCGGQLAAVKVFRNQGVVGRLQAVLHGQVQRGGCLAAAADAYENDVGLLQIPIGLAVVVRQRKIDGLDTVLVFLALAGVTESANAVVGLDLQFLFQGMHEHAKHVQQHAVAAPLNDFEHFHIDQGGKHNGAASIQLGGVVDLPYHLVGLVHGVHEGQAHHAGFRFKLGQDGVAKGLCGDAGAVRHKKYGALGHAGEVVGIVSVLQAQTGNGVGAAVVAPLQCS